MKFHGLKRMFAAPLMVLALGAPLTGVAEASVGLDVFAPNNGDLAGVGSRGFLVDLVARYDRSLAATGASPELTGPGAPANTAPLRGARPPARTPITSRAWSCSSRAAASGPAPARTWRTSSTSSRSRTRRPRRRSTWIIGGQNAFGSVGQLTRTRLFVAVVDGVAPNVVSDLDREVPPRGPFPLLM